MEKHGFESWADLGSANPALVVTGHMTLSRLLDFSESYFPYL